MHTFEKKKYFPYTWLQLVAYGQYTHAIGQQIFHRQHADTLVKDFYRLKKRCIRFFQPMCIYQGHPDDPAFASTDDRPYGYIQHIKADTSGLWINASWTPLGEEALLKSRLKHFSPRWRIDKQADGYWAPIELVSVGLTNQPNIPSISICNQEHLLADPMALQARLAEAFDTIEVLKKQSLICPKNKATVGGKSQTAHLRFKPSSISSLVHPLS